MELRFSQFAPGDLAEYGAWGDARTPEGRLADPAADWQAYVMGAAGAWAVRDAGGELIAVVETQGDASRGYISVTVAPAHRGRGIGAEALRAFQAGPGAHFAVLEGRIAPHNAASLSMARKAGFTLMSPEADRDGMLHFELRRDG